MRAAMVSRASSSMEASSICRTSRARMVDERVRGVDDGTTVEVVRADLRDSGVVEPVILSRYSGACEQMYDNS